MTRKERLQNQRNYQLEYYHRNKKKILQNLQEIRDKAKEKKRKANNDIELYEILNSELTKRLEEDNLKNWIRFAIQKQIEMNNDTLEKLCNK